MSKENGDNKFWLVSKRTGIKIFPRVGSTTLRSTYGQPKSKEQALKQDNVIVIVRSPWDRLLSVYNGMILARDNGLSVYGYPEKTKELDGLLEYIIDTPSASLDWHVRPMWDQLTGFVPDPEQIWTFDQIKRYPPFGLKKPNRHDHQTPDRMKIKREYSVDLVEQWEEKLENDWWMYRAALARDGRS